MYFKDRAQAGALLAEQLINYRYENCAVIALSSGSVLVAEQIAAELHCILMMLLIEDINIPGEDMNFGSITQDGDFTYNGMLSAGEIEEYTGEFHGYLDEKRREAFQDMNKLLGEGGIIDNRFIKDRVIIIVSDGFKTGNSLNVAVSFLKPMRIEKLVVVTPVASIPAVDKMHMLADEIHILDVKANFIDVNHYYDDNNIPSQEETIEKINQIILSWH
jgi:predicted phosphoribosyltransferase